MISFENWQDVFLEDDVNLIFNNFLNTYLRIFYASFQTTKSRNYHKSKPWLTNGIRISCANKRKLYLTYRNTNEPNLKKYYKNYCRILTSVIMTAKKHHYNKLLLHSNNKTTWNTVKTITNNKNTFNNISSMNIKDKPSRNPLVIANAFNNYFSSVAGNLFHRNFTGATKTSNDPLTFIRKNFNQLPSSLYLKKTTTHEIKKIIRSLKRKDSHGYDEILTRILKISAPYVLSLLTYIFNKILSRGVFPDRLKFSEVRPLY